MGPIYFVNKSVTQGHLYDLLPDGAIVYIWIEVQIAAFF